MGHHYYGIIKWANTAIREAGFIVIDPYTFSKYCSRAVSDEVIKKLVRKQNASRFYGLDRF